MNSYMYDDGTQFESSTAKSAEAKYWEEYDAIKRKISSMRKSKSFPKDGKSDKK